jgi:hypothetical protein
VAGLLSRGAPRPRVITRLPFGVHVPPPPHKRH